MTPLLAGVAAAIVTAGFVRLAIPALVRLGFVDQPNARSSHVVPTPRGAGLAFAGVATIGGLLVQPLTAPIVALYVGAFGVAVLGLIDDRIGLHPALRIVVHLAAAVALVTAGGVAARLAMTAEVALPLERLMVPFALLWVVGLTNAYNFMDGVDGLAAGQGVITAVAMALLAGQVGAGESSTALAVIAGAVAGFLPFNWPRARVFMGDVGSSYLGFMFAGWAVLLEVQAPTLGAVTLSAAVLSPFLLDTTATLARRIARGERWYESHREHYYQRLVQQGWSHAAVTRLYLAVSGTVAVLAVLSKRGWFPPQVCLAAAIAGFAAIVATVLRAEGWMRWSGTVSAPAGAETQSARRAGAVVDFALRYRRPINIILHAVLVMASVASAYWLRFDGDVPPAYEAIFFASLPTLLACRLISFMPFRLFEGMWRYTSIWDLRNILAGAISSSVLFLVVLAVLHPGIRYPRSILAIDTIVLIGLLSGVRLTRRIYAEVTQRPRTKRVVIVGAGATGEMIARDLLHRPEYDATPIGFIDDDRHLVGQRIHGVPVLGTCREIAGLVSRHAPDEVLIALPNASPETMRQIVRALDQAKVRITTVPNLAQMIGRPADPGQIRPLQVEDLLTRLSVGLNPAPLRRLMEGKRVLVTGAGGSIGSEISRQAAALNPAALIAVDRYENSLFALLNGVRDAFPSVTVHGVVADVTDERRVDAVFAEYRPDLVFHAAAHKHVPLMEANPCEAVKNNVTGSRIVAEASARHGAGRFIMISTDKAVNPTSVMGATKRVAELIVRELARGGSATEFVTVRFGNVLGSNGSVVPLFLEQIRRGGPVTVTDPEVRRYFMLIPEAVQLVLHAATLDGQGRTYVLDMGEQVSLLDLARDLIRLSGFVPEEEIPISFVGLRPGEKLFEELVGADEKMEPSPIDKVNCLRPTVPPLLNGELLAHVARLEAQAAAGDITRVLAALQALVPGYSRQGAPAGEPVAL